MAFGDFSQWKQLFCLILLVIKGIKALRDNDTRVAIVSFMDITDRSGLPEYQMTVISASNDTRYRIEMPHMNLDSYGELHPYSQLKPQFSVREWSQDLSGDLASETHYHALRIVSNSKLGIQASKATLGSTDALLVLPLTGESTEFFIPSFQNVPQGSSSFLVVSTYHDTCVEASYVRGGVIRRIFFKSLREFEVYQAYSKDQDFTGVYVNATRPVAVYGGHECGQVPAGIIFCDHLIEQIPPVSEWGTQHIAGQIIGRNARAGYLLRILSSTDNTPVTIRDASGNVLVSTSVDRGDYFEYIVAQSTTTTYIVCTVPCLVVQYNTGYDSAPEDNTVKPDPYMTIVVPFDHYTNFMTFSTMEYSLRPPAGTKSFNNYLTVVARTDIKDQVKLNTDKDQLTNHLQTGELWQTVAGTPYSVLAISIPHANYTLYHTDPAERFVAFVYGHSSDDPTSYGYPTGYDMLGPAIPGTWWEELLTTDQPPAPTVCEVARSLPPASEIGPYQEFLLRAFLKYKAVSSDCLNKYKIVLRAKLPALIETINNLICLGTLCPNTLYTHITELSIVAYNPDNSPTTLESLDVNVKMVTSIDEAFGDLIVCRRQVTAFLQVAYNWGMPISVINCSPLDYKQVVLLSQQYSCPVQ